MAIPGGEVNAGSRGLRRLRICVAADLDGSRAPPPENSGRGEDRETKA
jgi:hypothetical protein